RDAFHGRTLGALAATGNARYQEPFEPLPPGFVHVPWNDAEAIRAATTPNTVAVLLEPIQGEGGVNVPSPGYLAAVRRWCDERGLLLILDEIQTGMGRTGTFFAFEQEGIRPDIVCLAKGLAGGVPIGAVLAREMVAAHLVPGDHGTTFGGNPLACAAGVATVRTIIDEGLPARAAEAGRRLMARLRELEDRFPVVTEVRGRGLMAAVQLARDVASDVTNRCRERGLLVNPVRPNAIRLLPPLIVTDEEIDRACDILASVLSETDTPK
ncbi:MAG: aminotransferase class III-fold pyridoxal phosphate-dependent enzyme, partial [Dehalococcoidia bacterium]|nr:aminotransferase class III-fold pyridoxal phosphate-dependent enzyme [Dehalococcoidia bacterium]